MTSPGPNSSDLGSPIINPGAGLGGYLGAQAATNVMYTSTPGTGPYGQLRAPGFQAHHLNQNAAYKVSIPQAAGQSILLRGNAFVDEGSPHYEAHASLENWWDSYRNGGSLQRQVPTNAQYGQALKQSLVDAGMSPADATKYADVARQQRLANGLADDADVPKIPRRTNQPGGNVVDADLWAARGVVKNLAVVGRGAMVVGAAVDAYSFGSQLHQSLQTGNYSNTYREGARIAGGWSGAYVVGAEGAALGAELGLVFSPIGSVVGGFVGGVIGGGIGYFMGSHATAGLVPDTNPLPPGAPF